MIHLAFIYYAVRRFYLKLTASGEAILTARSTASGEAILTARSCLSYFDNTQLE
jgi:hypothetical protein